MAGRVDVPAYRVAVAKRCGMLADCDVVGRLRADIENLEAENLRLSTIIDTPENDDFLKGVAIEAEHARRRWKKDDIAKTPFEWMGLVLFLGGKCIKAYLDGDKDKAKHHAISTAAAMLNFHRMIICGNVG